MKPASITLKIAKTPECVLVIIVVMLIIIVIMSVIHVVMLIFFLIMSVVMRNDITLRLLLINPINKRWISAVLKGGPPRMHCS